MFNFELESKILTEINSKRTFPKSFSNLIKDFETKFTNFDPIINNIEVRNYFVAGTGQKATTKKLISHGKIKSKL